MKKSILAVSVAMLLCAAPVTAFSVEKLPAQDYSSLVKQMKADASDLESDTLEVISLDFDNNVTDEDIESEIESIKGRRNAADTDRAAGGHADIHPDPNINNTTYYPSSVVTIPFYMFPNERADESYTIYIQNAYTKQTVTSTTQNFPNSKDAKYLAYNWNTQGLSAGPYIVNYMSTYGGMGSVTVNLDFYAKTLTSIALDTNGITINSGESRDIHVMYNPYEATCCKTILWESSDSKKVSIGSTLASYSTSYNGSFCTVTARDFGSARITAQSVANKNLKAICDVSVKDATQVRNFVNRLYLILLGRGGDEAGLQDWTNRLLSGNATAAQIVQGFTGSEEFKNFHLNNSEIIERMYLSMLGRGSDAAGKADWMNRMNMGQSVDHIIQGFAGSPEFAAICARYGIKAGTIEVGPTPTWNPNPTPTWNPNPTPTYVPTSGYAAQNKGVREFVQRCYSVILGRQADPSGLEYWCKEIILNPDKKGAAGYVAATGFLNSVEFVSKGSNNEQYVRLLYKTFFDREPDPVGLADWVSQLNAGIKTRDQILYGFEGSVEFDIIIKSYGF